MTEEVKKPCDTQENQPNPPVKLIPKRWLVGKRLYKRSTMQLHNETIQVEYHCILNKVKKLLAAEKPTVFERDYRFDNTENSFTLHVFLTRTFYFYIECDFSYNYQLEYAFNNCKYEAEMRKLLDTYTLEGRATEKKFVDFNLFYDNVLAFQHERYVFVLQA